MLIPNFKSHSREEFLTPNFQQEKKYIIRPTWLLEIPELIAAGTMHASVT